MFPYGIASFCYYGYSIVQQGFTSNHEKAVLTAIAIPVFTGQLEKSREATDLSNCRAYYSEVTAALLTGDLDAANSTTTVQGLTATSSGAKGVAANGTFTVAVANAPLAQTVANWQTAEPQCAGVDIDETLTIAATKTITFTYTVQADGDIMLTGVAYS